MCSRAVIQNHALHGFFASCSGVPKMGQEEYFRVNRGPNRMDVRVAKAQASCCGVNLAVAEFWGCCFLRGCGE
jgi:hypothetical protein